MTIIKPSDWNIKELYFNDINLIINIDRAQGRS